MYFRFTTNSPGGEKIEMILPSELVALPGGPRWRWRFRIEYAMGSFLKIALRSD